LSANRLAIAYGVREQLESEGLRTRPSHNRGRHTIGISTDAHANLSALKAAGSTLDADGCDLVMHASDVIGIGPHQAPASTANFGELTPCIEPLCFHPRMSLDRLIYSSPLVP